MKKLNLIPLLFLVITACHSDKTKSFSQIKHGMQSKDVIALVGEPETKTSVIIADWWNYSKDNKMIVMSHDTVVRVVMDLKAAQDSMKTIGADMSKKMDSLSTALKTIDSAK
ncbi:MAG: hypothetical protein JWP37_3832 [Mucilaginibacter sp.]|nr:hypothetical protein [Mucilaginibacter sp.]